MLIFIIVVFVLALFWLARRYYKLPDLDKIQELLANTDVDYIEVSSPFFGITKLSFRKRYTLQTKKLPEPVVLAPKVSEEILSPAVGTFHWEFPKIPENSQFKVRAGHMLKIRRYSSTGCVGRIVKKDEVIARIEYLGGLKDEILSPIDGTIIKGIAVAHFKKGTPVECTTFLAAIE